MKANISIGIAALLLLSYPVLSQTHVNTEWSTISGLPVNIHWTASLIASTNHVITVGNTYTAGQEANVLLTKYSTDGSIVWQVEYNNVDSLGDYGIALAEDQNGNFLVAATSERLASTSLDICVLKFNSSGQLQWTYFFNGSANGDDIPTTISSFNGEPIVCGSSKSTGAESDFVTIKLNDQGIHQWTSLYDYNSLDDVATDMRVDPLTGDVTVTGGSADQSAVYDMATVVYDQLGSQQSATRSNYGTGIEQPTCFGTDTNGNAIIGGWYTDNANQVHMSLISLNDTLGLNWDTLYDPTTGEDHITDMAVDEAGHIYVTGHSEDPSDGFRVFTARYNPDGTQSWEKHYASPGGAAYGRRISLGANGVVDVTGMIYNGPDTNILLIEYDTNGKQKFSTQYDAGGAEVASSLETDHWGNIYIHGTTSASGSGYVTVKYATFTQQTVITTDTSDSFEFVDNEIVFQFLPQYMDSTTVDDQGKVFGQLSEFVKPAVIDSLNTLFSGAHNWGRMNAIKVFPKLRTTHTYSLSRRGDTIEMPPFWATIEVLTPSSLDEHAAAVRIDSALPHLIDIAELNGIYRLAYVPDDSLYFIDTAQNGLENYKFPDSCDINMERAWEIAVGSRIKVGVIDAGLFWKHYDFQMGTSFSFSDSKVRGGYNFVDQEPLSANANNDPHAHGTACAGIIAANSNNGSGIAGIAGGDVSSGNYGARLYGYKVAKGQPGIATAVRMSRALRQAASDINADDPGDALNVINISMGGYYHSALVRLLVKFAYDNECSVVASSGNFLADGNEAIQYPAKYEDRWIISVGANDSTGAWHDFGVEGQQWGSCHGNGLDLVAPGTPSLVTTTSNNTYGYWGFWGTSAAAPHTSGVAALMRGYRRFDVPYWGGPSIMFPEDVEEVMQWWTDSGIATNGYDGKNGHGRLDAGEIMEHLEWPTYSLESHSFKSSTSSTSTLVAQNVNRFLTHAHDGIPSGMYEVDIYRVDVNRTHTLPDSAYAHDAWALNGSGISDLWGNDQGVIEPFPHAKLVSYTDSTIHLRGYVYYVHGPTFGSGTIQQWIPHAASGAHKGGYTLYIINHSSTANTEELPATTEIAKLWPNPAGDAQTIEIIGKGDLSITLFDARGVRVKNVFHGTLADTRQWQVNTSKLAPGAYFYRIALNGEIKTLASIINH